MSYSNMRSGTGVVSRVELRSIDYVPQSERGGRIFDQSTVWFAGSAQLLSLATGAIGIGLGLNLGWTLVGLLVGTIVGTIPVSAHATQGPHLGLPQLVQSRPQFGMYGALYILAMAIIVYWGYVVLGGNLLGATANALGAGSAPLWAVITCILAIALAVFGYHWLHVAQRIITIALIIALTIYVIGLFAGGYLPWTLFDLTQSFDLGSFLVVVSSAAGYQLTWAFFVSDYSRYMPANISKKKIIAFTSTGLILGLFSFMAVGAIGAAVLASGDIINDLNTTGNNVFTGLGPIMLITGGLGLLGLMGLCVYGGSLTLITVMDSIRSVRPTRQLRVITILIIGVTSTVAAAFVPGDFLNNEFYTVLALCAYFLAPWTSINLTDFFIIRKGHYSIVEIFRKSGMYGTWNWRGLTTYVVTFVVMLPFMSLTFYQGFLAARMGVDIAFFIGVPFGILLYWLLSRNMDLVRERELIAVADANIESMGKPIE
jgi:purine-cytosine permease-like protein